MFTVSHKMLTVLKNVHFFRKNHGFKKVCRAFEKNVGQFNKTSKVSKRCFKDKKKEKTGKYVYGLKSVHIFRIMFTCSKIYPQVEHFLIFGSPASSLQVARARDRVAVTTSFPGGGHLGIVEENFIANLLSRFSRARGAGGCNLTHTKRWR